ncbi:glycosyltransferase family 2 protein [Desulfocurvus sp. DL9XJH121]
MTNPDSIFMSIVVPVYNVAQYLQRCFESILTQSLKDIEVICVNDASTDNSLSILESYSATDRRVKIINFDKNQGAGAARNAGICTAKGKTICFIDPDDFIPEGSLEKKATLYTKHNAIIKGRRVDITPEGHIVGIENFPNDVKQHPFTPKDKLRHLDYLVKHTTWLLPLRLLRDNGIHYKAGIKTSEDTYFLAQLFFHIEKMMCTDEIVYYAVHRQGSATRRKFTIEDYINWLECAETFYKLSMIHKKTLFGDHYFSNMLLHTFRKIIELSSKDTEVNNNFTKIVEYGLYLFKKYGAYKRYLNIEFRDNFPGIEMLVQLSHEQNGSISYKLHKAKKRMSQEAAKRCNR